MSKAVQCLVVLAVVAICFVTEIIPLAVTAMAGATACGVLGFVPVKTTYNGLANSTVVLFAAMFVLSSAMFKTGLAQKIGVTVVNAVGSGENSLMIGVMAITSALSAVCSNTGTAAALLPVVVGICETSGLSKKRQLMAMAFAAGAGGIITLIGTPPNIIASGALGAAGMTEFGFFEFAWIGIPLAAATIAYMALIGKRFFPARDESAGDAGALDDEFAAEAKADDEDPKKQAIVGFMMIAVVVVMALNLKALPLHVAATIGALLLVILKVVSVQDAYSGIDWTTIFLFAGMMTVASAMDKTGAGKLIADQVVGVLGGSPSPIFVTAVLFTLSCVLTQFMSNTASAALLCPIGLSIAQSIGADPHAVLMAIAVAASCAYATPVGTPPNTLVLTPGGFAFMDYMKAGIPLIIVSFVVSLIIIPMVWPFFP